METLEKLWLVSKSNESLEKLENFKLIEEKIMKFAWTVPVKNLRAYTVNRFYQWIALFWKYWFGHTISLWKE